MHLNCTRTRIKHLWSERFGPKSCVSGSAAGGAGPSNEGGGGGGGGGVGGGGGGGAVGGGGGGEAVERAALEGDDVDDGDDGDDDVVTSGTLAIPRSQQMILDSLAEWRDDYEATTLHTVTAAPSPAASCPGSARIHGQRSERHRQTQRHEAPLTIGRRRETRGGRETQGGSGTHGQNGSAASGHLHADRVGVEEEDDDGGDGGGDGDGDGGGAVGSSCGAGVERWQQQEQQQQQRRQEPPDVNRSPAKRRRCRLDDAAAGRGDGDIAAGRGDGGGDGGGGGETLRAGSSAPRPTEDRRGDAKSAQLDCERDHRTCCPSPDHRGSELLRIR
ncbi:uncharacterized protein LOC133363044 [Lethenteron reissneri]|uniref:uncharacterized protein LOC133363044 n=1 Tax=Lethenteron reissneri TaxID=7753 RepID=UPI002AB6822C|nr:uncharacterized protein LOC133363044 [Lethenteron reissneri]